MNLKFGEFLKAQEIISEAQLSEALLVQKYQPGRLGRILRDLGAISRAELNRLLPAFLNVQSEFTGAQCYHHLKNQTFASIYSMWAKRHGVFIFSICPDKVICLAEEFYDETLEDGERNFKIPFFMNLIEKPEFHFLMKNLNREVPFIQTSSLEPEKLISDDEKIASSSPYTSLFRDIMIAARQKKASDIHLQPTRAGIDIRFRVFGEIQLITQLDLEHRKNFMQEIKKLTHLSIAVSGQAQDSRVSFQKWNLDVRVSLLPSQFGEKIVLRLLDLERKFQLEALGFDQKTESDLKRALEFKNGVIVISGPTGSGKTTTLNAAVCALDRKKRNIITLEDPIEYTIEGVTQVQISSKLSFSQALRAVLRQDPDVILVGEIRDEETAGLCLKAAATGHLVLSTLHANGAIEVIDRFLGLNIDLDELTSNLRFSSAQRLVRLLCNHCKVPADEKTFIRNEKGCSQCQSGISGQQPILEYIETNQLKDYLFHRRSGQVQDPNLTQSLQSVLSSLIQKGVADAHDHF